MAGFIYGIEYEGCNTEDGDECACIDCIYEDSPKKCEQYRKDEHAWKECFDDLGY